MMRRARRRPTARVIARNVDLIVHESGTPAVQVRGLTPERDRAITDWMVRVRSDKPPHLVQSAEVNEREGIVPLPGENHDG